MEPFNLLLAYFCMNSAFVIANLNDEYTCRKSKSDLDKMVCDLKEPSKYEAPLW